MVLDVLALLVVAAFGFVGWRRGTVLMALSLAGFVAGYAAALFLYRPVGGLLASYGGMPAVLAYPVGGALAMLAVGLLLRFVRHRFLVRRVHMTSEGWQPSAMDRAGGAGLATVVGVGIALVVGWMANVLTELGGTPVRGLTGSYAGRAGAALAEPTIYAAMRLATIDDELAATLSAVMARPGRAKAALEGLMGSELFRRVRGDASFREALFSGDPERLLTHPLTTRMLEDEAFGRVFEAFSLTDVESGQERARELAATLGTFGAGIAALQNDETFRGSPLASQIQSGISSGDLDLVAISRSPQLVETLARINEAFRAQEESVEELGR